MSTYKVIRTTKGGALEIGIKDAFVKYNAETDGYYLRVDNETAKGINDAICGAFPKEFLKDEKQLFHIDPQYSTSGIGFKAYENAEKLGKKNNSVSAFILRVGTYTFQNKKGLSKSMKDCIIVEREYNPFQDDFFSDVDGAQPQPMEEPQPQQTEPIGKGGVITANDLDNAPSDSPF